MRSYGDSMSLIPTQAIVTVNVKSLDPSVVADALQQALITHHHARIISLTSTVHNWMRIYGETQVIAAIEFEPAPEPELAT